MTQSRKVFGNQEQCLVVTHAGSTTGSCWDPQVAKIASDSSVFPIYMNMEGSLKKSKENPKLVIDELIGTMEVENCVTFQQGKETNSGTSTTSKFNDDGELENWTRLEGLKTEGELRNAGLMDSFSNGYWPQAIVFNPNRK
ncbi:hypothetical protein QYF36_015196 [Acer negundo]|nr:hypothetical protein QYF36_015196 [Acer negundo]